VALFPRYAFVSLDLDRHRWRSVNGTLGVETLLMSADCPLPVPINVVEEILAAADEDGSSILTMVSLQVVRFDWSLDPLLGPLEPLSSSMRRARRLLLRMMNTSVRLKVPRDILERAT